MSLTDCVSPLPYACQVIAFYSYKGGVGRTMALCNVAAQIARKHSKRKDEMQSKTRGLPSKQLRILCVDLDLEAPGIPSYLPPARGTKVKGFLGLLYEYFSDHGHPRWKGELLKREIRRALGEQLSDYAYAVPKTDNLFVLPTGNLPADETVRIRRALYDLLDPIRHSDSYGKALEKIQFFSEFRDVLRELFDYTFVDSRTGLADTAYATTTTLADGMVFLFRPNLTQLLGIQDVFGRFLVERPELAFEGMPKRIPVIPALSPRPNFSTPLLQEVRKAAVERIFRWLDPNTAGSLAPAADRYAPAPPKLHELPFDSSLEIGERLIIPPAPDDKVEDEEAPIYKEYVELSKEIQKNNAEHDILGKETLEMEHYHAGRKDEGLNCLLSAIAAEPDNSRIWDNIWDGYANHLGSSSASRDQVLRFCEEARSLPEAQSVPRFFGALWLSEVYENVAPGKCPELITELWRIARLSMDTKMLTHGLTRITNYYDKHGSEPRLENCPSRAQAATAWMMRRLHDELDTSDLFNVLVGTESYFKEESETGMQGLELLQDQLSLTNSGRIQAAILADIAQAHALQGDLRSAYKAYAAAAALPECSEQVKRPFLFLQMRVLPRKVVEKSIQAILPKVLQPAVLMIHEIREGADVETVHAKLDDLQKVSPTVGEDPNFEYYALMHHRRFLDALIFMSKRIGKVKGGVRAVDLARLSLAQWLSREAALDKQITAYALAQVVSEELALDEPEFNACLALACCPKELGREAAKRLSKAQWPTTKFGWTFVSCITGQDYDVRHTELEAMLKDNPFLACLFRKHEDFPLLRFILERHASLGTVKPDMARRGIEVIDLIESVKVHFGVPPKPFKVPKTITEKDDPRFKAIIERWKRNLSWIRDDKEMRAVVDKLLEPQSAASATHLK